MLDKELLEQFQLLAGSMEQMEARIKGELRGEIKSLESRMLTKDDVEPLTDRSGSKAAALVEARLGKRIDSLVDGYKLTHEKQYELERRMEKLELMIEELRG